MLQREITDSPLSRSTMVIHVMDLSLLLSKGILSWLPSCEEPCDSPDDVILYTLIEGKHEAIMFGGIKKDSSVRSNQAGGATAASVFNNVHVISTRRSII